VPKPPLHHHYLLTVVAPTALPFLATYARATTLPPPTHRDMGNLSTTNEYYSLLHRVDLVMLCLQWFER